MTKGGGIAKTIRPISFIVFLGVVVVLAGGCTGDNAKHVVAKHIVCNFWQAWDREDLETVAALLDKDIRILFEHVEASGREHVLANIRLWFARYEYRDASVQFAEWWEYQGLDLVYLECYVAITKNDKNITWRLLIGVNPVTSKILSIEDLSYW